MTDPLIIEPPTECQECGRELTDDERTGKPYVCFVCWDQAMREEEHDEYVRSYGEI